MGCAPMAYVLYSRIMRYAPSNPNWLGRDRFVLSNGHGCALQYTMLHLTGYDISLDDLRNFRQLHSKTPGHPESFQTPGVEVTTGPLGQGVAQAVGLAIGGEMMAKRYNRPDFTLFDSFVYSIVGDGCLQEGVAAEACSLAGHLGLGRLIVLYDKNNISIDGHTDLSFTEDVPMRFRAYGWEVLNVADANTDVDGLEKAIRQAQNTLDRPTLIVCHTLIGYGSRQQGSEKVHGAPLGVDDILEARKRWNLTSEDNDLFSVSTDVSGFFRQCGMNGNAAHEEWTAMLQRYASAYPAEHRELQRQMSKALPAIDWEKDVPQFTPASSPASTRALSGQVLNALASVVPDIIGGSADLTGSNCSGLKEATDFSKSDRGGRYIRYGVREHGMAAITNGLFEFGGLRPFAATFLNFITYAWGAVRLSALSQLGVLYIATHDSIELGEDGPTHQPIEVAALCRSTPNLNYIRPADGAEVVAAYRCWLEYSKRPTVLALCRGNVPHLQGTSPVKALKGAYVLQDFVDSQLPRLLLASCGSELHLCVEAAKRLSTCFNVRVVSIPCWDIFLDQPKEYQNSVLAPTVKSLWVEAAHPAGCDRFFTKTLCMTSFGGSAPKSQLWSHFGFTVDNIEQQARDLMMSCSKCT